MKKESNECIINFDFHPLAGLYNPLLPQEMVWMNRVIEDMKAGGIEYRVVLEDKGYMVERKNMIVTAKK